MMMEDFFNATIVEIKGETLHKYDLMIQNYHQSTKEDEESRE